LAGVVDLAEGARLGLSNGAVAAALGGSIGQRPETYAEADPMARLPIGVPTLIVQGEQDDPHLVDMNRRYVAAARAAGDEVTQIQQPGDHFAVIDPASQIWRDTAAVLVDRLRLNTDRRISQPTRAERVSARTRAMMRRNGALDNPETSS
jgi:pimeloyl-ACP methyl ester carboxylesterase